jgi:mannose-1-phosphate guanylyltransferase
MKSESPPSIVILAGGQGTRFWPLSRKDKPKQFHSLFDKSESLIQGTFRRVRSLAGSDQNCIVVTNNAQSPLVKEHLPSAKVIHEPVGKNTAPSIGLAALYIEKKDPRGVMVVLPADQVVANDAELIRCLSKAVTLAKSSDSLVTIGVTPTSAHTGYGYIKRGLSIGNQCFAISRFYEKPNVERAAQYLESGDYYWNSGMFVWRVDVLLQAIREYLPALWNGLQEIKPHIGSAKEPQILQEIFPQLESISIDIGVLEHARNCIVVEADSLGWSDVGSWDSWAEKQPADKNSNVLLGDVLAFDTQNCVVRSPHRLTAIIGVEDLIVVDSGDALLICPRDRLQDIKRIVDELQKSDREDLI